MYEHKTWEEDVAIVHGGGGVRKSILNKSESWEENKRNIHCVKLCLSLIIERNQIFNQAVVCDEHVLFVR